MLMQVFLEPYNKGLHSFFDCSSLGARHRPAWAWLENRHSECDEYALLPDWNLVRIL